MTKIDWINSLERWRQQDQEDKLVLSRNDVIELLEQILDLKQELENTKYHIDEFFK